MTSGPNYNEDPDTEGRTLPPYEGRRETADVDGPEESVKDGAKTAGAAGPVEDNTPKAPEPAETEGGEHASPADEQPGAESPATDLDPDMVGPSHEPGTIRGEDES